MSEPPTLSQLFGQRQATVRAALETDGEVSAAVRTLEQLLHELNAATAGQRTPLQAGQVGFMLDALGQAVRGLTCVRGSAVAAPGPPATRPAPREGRSYLPLLFLALRVFTYVGVLAALFFSSEPAAAAGFLVLLLLGLEVALFFVMRRSQAAAQPEPPPTPPPPAAGPVRVEAGPLLERLGRALDTVDRAAAQLPAGSVEPDADSRLADLPGVLPAVQQLLGAARRQRDDVAELTVDVLTELLNRHNLRALDYRPGDPDARERFALEAHTDPARSDAVTLRPAVLAGDGSVVERGRAVVPAGQLPR